LRTIAAADVNGDGLDDIAIGGDPTPVALLTNQGGGNFASSLLVQDGTTPSSLLFTDFDGDGRLDLLAGMTRPTTSFAVFVGRDGGEFNAGSLFDLASTSIDLVAGDFNGDAAPDVVSVPFSTSAVSFFANEQLSGRTLRFSAPNILSTNTNRPHTGVVGDFDLDGDLDVLTGNNFDGVMGRFENQGNGEFLYSAAPSRLLFFMAASDFDLDGDLDLAAVITSSVVLLLNDGEGNFPEAEDLSVSDAFQLTNADLTGDGADEVIAARNGANAVGVLVNRRDGTFEEVVNYNVGSNPLAVAAGDVDADGDLDVASANERSGSVSILLNDGTGILTLVDNFPLSGAPRYVVAADFDSDGFDDFATANSALRQVSVLWSDGTGGIEATGNFDVFQEPYSVTIADLNVDGFPEIMTIDENADNSRSAIVVLQNLEGRQFASAARLSAGRGSRFVVSGDFDEDGDHDLLGLSRGSRDATFYTNELVRPIDVDFLELICTPSDYFELSLPSTRRGAVRRVGKYVAPARDDATLLPTLFQNTNRYQLHEVFLGTVFADRFPAILTNPEEYDALVGRRETRDYFVGGLDVRQEADGLLYTFSAVADTGYDFREVLTQEEVGDLFERLSEAFTLRPLVYSPVGQLAKDAAKEWLNPAFPVFFDDAPPTFSFEGYTLAVGYGRVRVLTLSQFNEVNASGRLTFQDIVVIDEAPADIEGVVGGVITGAVQGELNHLAVRTARRGTPNAFVANAREAFTPFNGKLVRLEVFPGEYFVTEVELEEAEDFWANNRREFSTRPLIDDEYRGLDNLREIDLEAQGSRPESRYGGKASNMARLQSVLTGEFAQYQERGFAIPMSYYQEFMRTNVVDVNGRQLTYEEWILELLSLPEVLSDSQERFRVLDEFRDFVRDNGQLNVELVSALTRRIEEEFGDTLGMVRFRSSSNIEDALEFNGAGLYESTSVCAEDTLDPSSRDGSYCDPLRDNERTIERALRKVWASLWTFRAHEERTFYQLDPSDAAMGILVTRAFLDETVNGVAFTGDSRDPSNKDYVVTAQIGEESVVSPRPGTTVERSVLEVVDGEVVNIRRTRGSSLVPAGEVVMTDEKLRELGRVMWHVEQTLELDIEGNDPEDVILDFEFKVTPDGSVAVKQVRPFLIPQAQLETPEFELQVPPRTAVCGVFSADRVDRALRVEYETKSMVYFTGGTYRLPSDEGPFEADLISEVYYGPEQELAVPLEAGRFRVEPVANNNQTTYRFSFEQEFGLDDGRIVRLSILQLEFRGRGKIALDGPLVFSEMFLTNDLVMDGRIDGNPLVAYSSCSYRELPRWQLAVDLDDGSRIDLIERFLPVENQSDTGQANLVRASVNLGGQVQTTSDYWRLVYSADRHNLRARYWIVLDPALDLGLPRSVRIVEVAAPEPPIGPNVEVGQTRVRYLDDAFEVLAEPSTSGFLKEESGVEPGSFVRGDFNADGSVTISDAIGFLDGFFGRGAMTPCQKAADANDDSQLNIRDPVRILQYLFQGGNHLPPPAAECDVDPTPDDLLCRAYPPCL
ncbi:MAG: FG-GAP-like repeat-containing protein, partial [Planctomycetes bacterium]|nr:FG-GAP-like repeat-containing protein [Planctomycetota bacterium]